MADTVIHMDMLHAGHTRVTLFIYLDLLMGYGTMDAHSGGRGVGAVYGSGGGRGAAAGSAQRGRAHHD